MEHLIVITALMVTGLALHTVTKALKLLQNRDRGSAGAQTSIEVTRPGAATR
jgi:hypothetical protein